MSERVGLPPPDHLTLAGDGFLLRPWQPADAREIAAAYRDDPEIPRRTGFPYRLSEAEAIAYIAERSQAWAAGGKAAFGVFDLDERLLGSVSLLAIDGDAREAQVGYWLARSARGRGVATRAVELIAAWASELGLKRLTATVEVSNDGSRRVLERARFRCQGVLPKNQRLHEEWIDEYLYVRALG